MDNFASVSVPAEQIAAIMRATIIHLLADQLAPPPPPPTDGSSASPEAEVPCPFCESAQGRGTPRRCWLNDATLRSFLDFGPGGDESECFDDDPAPYSFAAMLTARLEPRLLDSEVRPM